jgi:hypothetical protein
LFAAALCCGTAKADDGSNVPPTQQSIQNSAAPSQTPKPIPTHTPQQEKAQVNPSAPCIQPPPMVTWQEYRGPFQKTVGLFARRLERKSVGTVQYKKGALMCTLTLKGKLHLFLGDATDPVTYLSIAYNAGMSQAQNSDPSFGQGAAGYGKRFAAGTADDASSLFFKDFAYPTLFREDPRYYPLGEGSTDRRFWHACKQAFVAHSQSGHIIFNYSEWLGTISAASVSNLYHPGNKRGFSPTAENVGESVGNDVGFDVLREFWPQIAHKFRLPFRHSGQQ